MARNYNKRSEKEYGFFRKLWYFIFVSCVVVPVLKLMYNIKIEGRENIPKNSNVIYAGNHVSYLDPPIVAMSTRKFIAYMAKQELFTDKNKLLRFLVHSLGAFAVNREKPEISTFKTLNAVFNTSWSLGIFPQGHIVKEHVIDEVNKGFVLFAKKYKADVVPVAICGYDGYAKKLFEKHLTAKIGKPISYELSDDEIIAEWVRQICEMTGFEDRITKKEAELV